MTKASKADTRAAIKALGINVPVYRAERTRAGIVLHLYGRTEPVTWKRPSAKPPVRKPKASAKPPVTKHPVGTRKPKAETAARPKRPPVRKTTTQPTPT